MFGSGMTPGVLDAGRLAHCAPRDASINKPRRIASAQWPKQQVFMGPPVLFPWAYLNTKYKVIRDGAGIGPADGGKGAAGRRFSGAKFHENERADPRRACVCARSRAAMTFVRRRFD
jgi:hypothetical protein